MASDDEAAARAKQARIDQLSKRHRQLRISAANAWGADETIAMASEMAAIEKELKALGETTINGLPLD